MKAKFLLGTVGVSAVLFVAYAFAGEQAPVQRRSASAPPELIGGPWLNTKDGAAVTLESRVGKPTLVAFWTFACSNCQANMPAYARLLAKYRPKGVELISVHTPELSIERDLDQVKSHAQKFGIDYPILVDGDHKNWDRWHIRYWPTLFVLDGRGKVVRYWEGELNWQGADGEVQVGKTLDRLLASAPGS